MKRWWIVVIILFLIVFFCFDVLIEDNNLLTKIKNIFYSKETKQNNAKISLQIVGPEGAG